MSQPSTRPARVSSPGVRALGGGPPAHARDRGQAGKRHSHRPGLRSGEGPRAHGSDDCTPDRRRARRQRSRNPLDRRERPRRRGERDGRSAPRHVRARRPQRLRRHADPRQRRRGHRAHPEPGRARGGAAPELVRVRHEPRLVRPDAAPNRLEGRARQAVPARPLHRRPRDGDEHLLLPAERRPGLSRGHGSGRRLDQRHLRRRDEVRVQAVQDPLFQRAHLRLLRGLLRRHRARERLPGGRDDLREVRRRQDRRAHARAVRRPVDVHLERGDAEGAHPQRVAPAWVGALAQGRAGQLEPNGVVNPKNAIEQTVPAGPVRNYFIRDDDPAHAREVQSLVRRLQRMEVDVYRLSPTFILTAVRAPRRRSPPAPTGSHSSSARSTGYRRC
jgi:hypothetical protein